MGVVSCCGRGLSYARVFCCGRGLPYELICCCGRGLFDVGVASLVKIKPVVGVASCCGRGLTMSL